MDTVYAPLRLWRQIPRGGTYYAVLEGPGGREGFSSVSDHPLDSLRSVLRQAGRQNPPPGWRLVVWGCSRRATVCWRSGRDGAILLEEQRPAGRSAAEEAA